MNRDHALETLDTGSSYDRLKAARALLRSAKSHDRDRLIAAQRRESDAWVRKALDNVLARLAGVATNPTIIESAPTDDELTDAYTRGEQDTVQQILHEVSPLVGLVAVNASQEIVAYAASKTRLQVERLKRLVIAMRDLGEAFVNQPDEEFDFGQCLTDAAHAAAQELGWSVDCAGLTPMVINSKPTLVDLVVSNALRNAIEAEQQVQMNSAIVLSWGETAKEYWLSVLDRGVGLPPGFDKAFEKGTSTKTSHSGMGLAIVQRAARSLNGKPSLRARAGGGTAFDLRWPKDAKGVA